MNARHTRKHHRAPRRDPHGPAAPGSAFGLGRPPEPDDEAPELELERDILVTLADPGPLSLMTMTSALAAATDAAANPGPFDGPPDSALPTTRDLIDMFRTAARPATDALLLMLSAMTANQSVQRRVTREVAGRKRQFPAG